MKTVKLVVAVSLCAALSFSAFGAPSQEQATQQGQTMRLAYYGDCWWHHGIKYCNYPYYYHRHHHHFYKKCWTGYYGRIHCRYYRY